jgi:NADPH:quinone reductase
MRAVTIREKVLSVEDHLDPTLGHGQVLVQVAAAGLNGADMMQRKGNYPAPLGAPPDIPGLELSGIVAAVGPGAVRFNVGDRVMGIVGGGGQAQLAVVHERILMPVPDAVDLVHAGGLPEVFTTAHDAIFTQAGLRSGERLLVHGAAGGVGTAAVQLGVVAGAQVTATVRNPDHHDAVAALGASVFSPEQFIEATTGDPQTLAAIGGPFDVILELVGAVNLASNLIALNVNGRICIIGTSAGAKGELHLGMLMMKRARMYGSTLRARPLEEKALTARAVEKMVLPHFATGALTVPLAETFGLEDAVAAYDRFAAGGKFGKIILTNAG